MKNKILAVLMMGVIAIGLIACGSKEKNYGETEKSRKLNDESNVDLIRCQMQNTLADPDFSHIGAIITYNDVESKSISVKNPTSVAIDMYTLDSEVTAFLEEVSDNVDDCMFKSKCYMDNPKVVYVIGSEKVKVYRAAVGEVPPAGTFFQ